MSKGTLDRARPERHRLALYPSSPIQCELIKFLDSMNQKQRQEWLRQAVISSYLAAKRASSGVRDAAPQMDLGLTLQLLKQSEMTSAPESPLRDGDRQLGVHAAVTQPHQNRNVDPPGSATENPPMEANANSESPKPTVASLKTTKLVALRPRMPAPST